MQARKEASSLVENCISSADPTGIKVLKPYYFYSNRSRAWGKQIKSHFRMVIWSEPGNKTKCTICIPGVRYHMSSSFPIIMSVQCLEALEQVTKQDWMLSVVVNKLKGCFDVRMECLNCMGAGRGRRTFCGKLIYSFIFIELLESLQVIFFNWVLLMKRSMWQDIRDCDYSYMVNGLCSMDVTLILRI